MKKYFMFLIAIIISMYFNFAVFAVGNESINSNPDSSYNMLTDEELLLMGDSSLISNNNDDLLRFLNVISSVGYTPDTYEQPTTDDSLSSTLTNSSSAENTEKDNSGLDPTLALLLGVIGSVAFANSFETSPGSDSQYNDSETIIWNGYKYYNANASYYEIQEARSQNGGYEGVVYNRPSYLLYNNQLWIQQEYVGDSAYEERPGSSGAVPSHAPNNNASEQIDDLAASFLSLFS